MLNLFHISDPVQTGSSSQWTTVSANTAYEAVASTSDDTTYITSATAGNISNFVCHPIAVPIPDFIAGFYVHLRMRAAATGTVQVTYGLYRGGSAIVTDTATVTNRIWKDFKLWVRYDPSTSSRFKPSGLGDIGVSVRDDTGSPGIHVSKLYLETVWMPSEYRYDSLEMNVTPDAVSGDLQWTSSGSSSATITSDILTISDTGTSQYRNYNINVPNVGDDYVREAVGRLKIETSMSSTSFISTLLEIGTNAHTVKLCAFLDSGDKYIGLIDSSGDRNNPSDYIVKYQHDWSDYFIYHLIVDADPNNFVNGVSVAIDGNIVIESDYSKYTDTSASSNLLFGTGDSSLTSNECTLFVDYIGWYIYRKRNKVFRGWRNIHTSTNNIEANSTDPDIVKLFNLSVPQITVGQSDYCCKLVLNDVSGLSYIETIFNPIDSTPLNLDIDYKGELSAGTVEVTIQRTSDMYYWNNSTSAWQAAKASATSSGISTRTRVNLMSGIITTLPDYYIIRVAVTGGFIAYSNIYVYKVWLHS